MAEYLCGTEEEFVASMNKRAEALGMNDTHFVNCCGLDVDGHVTSTNDIAIMSRELITHYPQIHEYTTIWQEDITHTTRRGSKPFTLSNTNKLIRQYEYANGLKTGSTSQAKFCLSATAKKDGIELIAVIMAAPDPKIRFQDARTLLNYGFAHCQIYNDKTPPKLQRLSVQQGKKDQTALIYEKPFQYLDLKGSDLSAIQSKLVLPKNVTAPCDAGKQVGRCEYYLGKEKIGCVRILYGETVEKAGFFDCYYQLLQSLF